MMEDHVTTSSIPQTTANATTFVLPWIVGTNTFTRSVSTLSPHSLLIVSIRHIAVVVKEKLVVLCPLSYECVKASTFKWHLEFLDDFYLLM